MLIAFAVMLGVCFTDLNVTNSKPHPLNMINIYNTITHSVGGTPRTAGHAVYGLSRGKDDSQCGAPLGANPNRRLDCKIKSVMDLQNRGAQSFIYRKVSGPSCFLNLKSLLVCARHNSGSLYYRMPSYLSACLPGHLVNHRTKLISALHHHLSPSWLFCHPHSSSLNVTNPMVAY